MMFPTHTIMIYKEIEGASVDGYGTPKPELVLQTTTKGDFQPMSPAEAKREAGSMVSGMYRLYLPAGIQIDSACKIKVEGLDNYLSVFGIPQRRNALIPHIKVLLELER